jgi:hypothetical protein
MKHSISRQEGLGVRLPFRHLLDFGIAPTVARDLSESVEETVIVDTIDYVSHLAAQPGNRIRHAQSLLVHYLRNDIRVPTIFVTSRQRREQEEKKRTAEQERQRITQLKIDYEQFCDREIERQIVARHSESELMEKLEILRRELITDPKIARCPIEGQRDIARRQLAKRMRSELSLPSFENWCGDPVLSQGDLFVES